MAIPRFAAPLFLMVLLAAGFADESEKIETLKAALSDLGIPPEEVARLKSQVMFSMKALKEPSLTVVTKDSERGTILAESAKAGFGIITANNKGGSGCTSSSKCSAGEGDCDSDAHCSTGLKCFQRSNSDEVPGVDTSALTGYVKTTYDFCYDPNYTALTTAIDPDDPCANPVGYGLAWRNDKTWCEERTYTETSTMEYGQKRLDTENRAFLDRSVPETFVTWSAGIIHSTTRDHYGNLKHYSVCGCKMAIMKVKRRAQHYGAAKMTCPATFSLDSDGISAGPDGVLGDYWCPVGMPWKTAARIVGCATWSSIAGNDFKANCDLSPAMVNYFG